MAPKKEKEAEKQEKKLSSIDSILGEYSDLAKQKKIQGFYGARAGDDILSPQLVTTSSFEFDMRLGGGFRDSGWARFYGQEECGKTSIGLRWARNWQHTFENAFIIFFNAEGRLTKDLLDRSEIDYSSKRFRIVDTNSYDTICDIMEKAIHSNEEGNKYFFIVDSTDACERQIDKGKAFSESEKIAGGAAILSLAGKRLSLLFSVSGNFLFICSQMRDRMKTGPAGGGGKSPSGGNAPKYYSSLSCEILKPWSKKFIRENPSDDKSRIIGRYCEIDLDKTPNETTGSTVTYPVKYGLKGGVWRSLESMNASIACGLTLVKGAWYSFEPSIFEDLKSKNINVPEKMQGEKTVREIFDSNPELTEYMLQKAAIIYSARKEIAFSAPS